MRGRSQLTFCVTAAALWCLPILAGCAASTHEADVKSIDDPYHQKGRFQWNDSKLKSWVRIEKADADRTETGLLRVRMVLRNKTKEDVVVDIRTLFTDEKGFEKESTNWEQIVVTARTQKDYTAVSLGPNVHDYQVVIRDGRNYQWRP